MPADVATSLAVTRRAGITGSGICTIIRRPREVAVKTLLEPPSASLQIWTFLPPDFASTTLAAIYLSACTLNLRVCRDNWDVSFHSQRPEIGRQSSSSRSGILKKAPCGG